MTTKRVTPVSFFPFASAVAGAAFFISLFFQVMVWAFLAAGSLGAVLAAWIYLLAREKKALSAQVTAAEKAVESAREEMVKVAGDARNAMAVKDEFLANMSHEIRNPMNGIIGMMHVLLTSELDDEQRNYANIVYNSARALLGIVNDILDLSKIEAGKLELDIRPFDLEISVRDMVSLPELQARQKELEFNYAIDPEVPRRLKGDIGRIRQVVLNLLGNAIKFTDAGSVSLNITLIRDLETSAGLHFEVSDTGIGISDAQIDHIFGFFNQADISITKKYGGTGLGLAICKLLIEKMGGQIGVKSTEMVGSIFWFDIDLGKSTAEDTILDLSKISLADSKVLVISDSPQLGKQLQKNLDGLGLEYDQALDTTEAFEMIKWARDDYAPFHAVIMEVRENGEFARKLAKKIRDALHGDHRPRLILITGVGYKGEARECEEIGFSAFLSKPVEEGMLSDCLRAVFSRPVLDEENSLPIITRYSIEESKKISRRILVVEDMETNLITAKVLIGKQGYATDEARNGEEAVAKQKDTPYDLILMDCQMPVMDGYKAARLIRSHEAKHELQRVPIIAMTGNAFEKDREKCYEAGMDDFISKPVEPDILVQKLLIHLSNGAVVQDSELRNGASTAPDQDIIDSDQEMLDFLDNLPVSDAPLFDDGADPSLDSPPADPFTPKAHGTKPDTSGADALCFNRETLYKRFGEDEELVGMVLNTFFEEAPGLFSELDKAIAQANTEAVRFNAHALKGAAANVNADRLSRIALGLETAAKTGDITHAGDVFLQLRDEYEAFTGEVKQ